MVGDVYYGFITLLPALVLSFADPGAKTTSIGPVGLRAEYMVSNVVGVGGDLQLSRYTSLWTERKYDRWSGAYYDYYYKVKWTRIRVMARVAFHFAVSRAVDPYLGISGGTRIESIFTETNGSSYKEDESGVDLAVRLALGTRFFFTPNIGAFAEVGVFGGGLFHVGLSIKLK
jgi:hypothetical protein